MKRSFCFSALLAFLLCFSMEGYSQGRTPVKGDFQMKSSLNADAVHANFVMTPTTDDHVVLKLHPDKQVLVNARIVNSKGEEVQKLESEQVSMRYAKSIDVSSLPAGSYFIEIFYGNQQADIYRIPFSK